jgi:hypothetical protein
MIKTDPTKFYTVYGVNGDVAFNAEQLFLTIDDAAKFIVNEVNAKLKKYGKTRRVNIKNCYDGYLLMFDGVMIDYKIAAHDRPYVVRFMDCDDMTDKLTVYQTKAEAEAAVAKDAKAGIKALGEDVEYVYADRQGDCEIPKNTVKKSEPYVMVDTYGGNHINWVSQQL